jgi:hypothetical protein
MKRPPINMTAKGLFNAMLPKFKPYRKPGGGNWAWKPRGALKRARVMNSPSSGAAK